MTNIEYDTTCEIGNIIYSHSYIINTNIYKKEKFYMTS